MDLLGPSLNALFVACGSRFSLPTVVLIGLQAIDRLETLHRACYVHRDIKPDIIGAEGNDRTIYMIDFGLTSRFYDNVYDTHIPYSEGNQLTGTRLFASPHQHRGIAHSRRDDIISLVYMLLFFVQGSLPWQNLWHLTPSQKTDDAPMAAAKARAKAHQLCRDLPSYFARLYDYAILLDFDEEPKYWYIRALLRYCVVGMAETRREMYDWEL